MKTIPVSIDFLKAIKRLLENYKESGCAEHDTERCEENISLIEEMMNHIYKTTKE